MAPYRRHSTTDQNDRPSVFDSFSEVGGRIKKHVSEQNVARVRLLVEEASFRSWIGERTEERLYSHQDRSRPSFMLRARS